LFYFLILEDDQYLEEDHVATTGMMIDELGRIWEEEIVAEVIFLHGP
jgi:hypothetical protein